MLRWFCSAVLCVGVNIAAAQTPQVSSVVNLASGEELLSPGVLAAIFGDDLAQPSTVPISVLVNGTVAFVITQSAQEVTGQLPVEVPPGAAMLEVERQSERSAPFPITLETHAPGLFARGGNFGQFWRLTGLAVTPASPAAPGEELWVLATGLGPTNPQVGTGSRAPSSPLAVTLTMPTITVGGQQASVLEASLQVNKIGRYQVFFVVPDTLPEGNHSLSLEIGGQISNTVLLPVVGLARPVINSVVNAASFGSQGLAAPGSILTIFGLNFGTGDSLHAFPSTSFEGLSVTFDGIPAPLFAVVASKGQINLLAPSELPEFGNVTMELTAKSGFIETISVQMVPTDPGIFRIFDPSGTFGNNAAALFGNTAWLVVPETLASSLRIPGNCAGGGINPASICGQPAAPGDILSVFVTGLGKATPNGDPSGSVLPTGNVAPSDGNPLYLTVQVPLVTIGNIPAEVLYSGLAPGFAGLYQLNVRVPAGVPPSDEVAIRVEMPNGLADTATIAVGP